MKNALCQMKVDFSKDKNIAKARSMILQAADAGAQIIVLPEMFNCPYSSDYFPDYAETYPEGETIAFLREMAYSLKVGLIAGSIPESYNSRVYNTSFIFGPTGVLLGRHRKAHLFDVDITGGITFKESETLARGDGQTVVDLQGIRVGVAICYDMRFPELMRKMVLAGAEMLVIPAAFNMTTGPAHWETTIRARAIDNQVYMAVVSPARDYQGPYVAYGHSMAVDPWGTILASAKDDETIVYWEFDRQRLNQIRKELPLLIHRRPELY